MTSAAQPSVAATNSIPPVKQICPHIKPEEISFPLPKSLYTTAHIHLTFLDTSVMVFLTTTTVGGNSAGSVKPMGSFIYAMPDVRSTATSFDCPVQGSISMMDVIRVRIRCVMHSL